MGLNALYLKHPSDRELEVERLGPFLGAAGPDECLLFAESGGASGLPLHEGQAGNLFYPYTDCLFDRLVVGTQVRLFRNPWSRALLRHLYQSVAPGGALVVPYHDEPAASRKSYWSVKALRKFFRARGRVHEARKAVEFTRGADLREVDSVLNWYFKNYGALLIANAVEIELDDRSPSPGLLECLLGPVRLARRGAVPPVDAEPDRKGRFHNARLEPSEGLQSEAYLVGGIGYKSALLSHIAGRYLNRRGALSLLDHGGGTGFLAAEMLLQDDLDVRRSVCCDISFLHALCAHRMFIGMRDRLEGRFFHHLGATEGFPYDDQYDLISFIGSLLYVPRPHVARVLEDAWKALRPGGILVVQENIKSPTYDRDCERMFTLEELDALLGTFGSADLYLPTATVQVTREGAGSRSVFRVVQKA